MVGWKLALVLPYKIWKFVSYAGHKPNYEFQNFLMLFIHFSALISMQFVNFTSIMESNSSPEEKEASFALAALMEVPLQYKASMELGILGYVCYFLSLYFFVMFFFLF